MFAKLFFKFIIIPALIVGGFGYVMYTRTGKIPFVDNGWLELSSSANQSTKKLRNIISNKSNTGSSGKQTFYKWQDKNGQWHYGSKAPEEVQAKSITYDPNRNTVAAIKVKPSSPPSKQKEGKFSMPSSSSTNITGDPSDAYKPENIVETIKNAKNIQKNLNDRIKKQQEALNNLH